MTLTVGEFSGSFSPDDENIMAEEFLIDYGDYTGEAINEERAKQRRELLTRAAVGFSELREQKAAEHISPNDRRSGQITDFVLRTEYPEMYAKMMTMTQEEILEYMEIEPEDATERLRLLIQETLDIADRRKKGIPTPRPNSSKKITGIEPSNEHYRRTA